MAIHIKRKAINVSTTYEPNVLHSQGICENTVGKLDKPFTMQYGFMPPGAKTRAHYHTEADRGNYVIRGCIRYIFGPTDNRQIIDAEAGDFIFTPKGEIHSQMNLSETEPAEFIGVYIGCADRDQSGKTWAEEPLTT